MKTTNDPMPPFGPPPIFALFPLRSPSDSSPDPSALLSSSPSFSSALDLGRSRVIFIGPVRFLPFEAEAVGPGLLVLPEADGAVGADLGAARVDGPASSSDPESDA